MCELISSGGSLLERRILDLTLLMLWSVYDGDLFISISVDSPQLELPGRKPEFRDITLAT